MKNKSATAFAPATVANVAVGFDILGFALGGLGEIATVEKLIGNPQVIMNPIAGFPNIPTDPRLNTATAGLLRLIRDKNLSFGFRVTLTKKIPVGSGLGGSSASAVAAVVAANGLLPKKLSTAELLEYALVGEEVASGSRHGDNVAPCLEGGLVFVRCHPQSQVVKIKVPSSLRCVIALPELSINTKEARGILQASVELPKVIAQTANLAGFILSCWHRDMALMRASLKDAMIEPQRAKLIPCFLPLQKAAMDGGALGCSISGAGPAIFALAENQKSALNIHRIWTALAEERKFAIQKSWISRITPKGACLVRR